ncbi:DUF4352 domain-containing protein [Jonesia quinghaiensis]|uniref:DUF4352 domain-containing protein n=1 Tax=Jonesia quinghaiensis TaxID=262806 RepID=UPI0012FC3449|nr:DUF4352 domain-containing protein [Jonesia quinghaiensis]
MSSDNRFSPPQPFSAQSGPQATSHGPQHPSGGNDPSSIQPPLGSHPTQRKNWFARHKFLTALGIIATLIVVGSALGGGTSPSDNVAASTDSTNNSGESSTQESVPGIGENVTAGDMSYTVTAIDTTDTVGPSFLSSTAKGTFVLVTVEVTNNSNESSMVDSSFFTLRNGEKSYQADSSASMYANTDEDGDSSSFFIENLNPDLTMTGIVVFDVPESIASATDNVLQAQTGFWGTETVDIALSK